VKYYLVQTEDYYPGCKFLTLILLLLKQSMFIKLLYHIIFYIMKYYSVQVITMCYDALLLNT